MSLRDHLQALYDQHGHLTPGLVVEAARPKTSPLHRAVFDKPVKEAAAAYYEHRAHQLIQSFKVTYRPASDTDPGLRVRKWHAVRTDDGHIYKTAEDVAADPILTEIVLRDMEREWRALHARYSRFQEFTDLVNATLQGAA